MSSLVKDIEGIGVIDIASVTFVSECSHDSGEFHIVVSGVSFTHYGDSARRGLSEAVKKHHGINDGSDWPCPNT